MKEQLEEMLGGVFSVTADTLKNDPTAPEGATHQSGNGHYLKDMGGGAFTIMQRDLVHLSSASEQIEESPVIKITDKTVEEILKISTQIRHLNEYYKTLGLVFDAMIALSPGIDKLERDAAFKLMHSEDEAR